MTESGYTCSGTPSTCTPNCGDGLLISPEICDDSSNDGIGCLASCTGAAAGYTCTSASPSVCTSNCGNGANDTTASPAYTEQCDDNNLANSDGCSSICQIEVGWICNGFPSVCSYCSNSLVEGTETCDDGTNDGLGCAVGCTSVNPSYTCTGTAPTVCTLNCGNGILDSGELCD